MSFTTMTSVDIDYQSLSLHTLLLSLFLCYPSVKLLHSLLCSRWSNKRGVPISLTQLSCLFNISQSESKRCSPPSVDVVKRDFALFIQKTMSLFPSGKVLVGLPFPIGRKYLKHVHTKHLNQRVSEVL